jgi:hypothetical protein
MKVASTVVMALALSCSVSAFLYETFEDAACQISQGGVQEVDKGAAGGSMSSLAVEPFALSVKFRLPKDERVAMLVLSLLLSGASSRLAGEWPSSEARKIQLGGTRGCPSISTIRLGPIASAATDRQCRSPSKELEPPLTSFAVSHPSTSSSSNQATSTSAPHRQALDPPSKASPGAL